MTDVVPKYTRLIIVLSVPALWALFAFAFAHAEHAQRVSNVTAMHCLILAAFPLVITLPIITIKRTESLLDSGG